jgi:hypothetical protein
MFGAEIADPLLYGLIPVSFVMVVTLIAWIIRELARISVLLAKLQERIEHLEDRIDWMTEQPRGRRRDDRNA